MMLLDFEQVMLDRSANDNAFFTLMGIRHLAKLYRELLSRTNYCLGGVVDPPMNEGTYKVPAFEQVPYMYTMKIPDNAGPGLPNSAARTANRTLNLYRHPIP
jgi:hypothetical protein